MFRTVFKVQSDILLSQIKMRNSILYRKLESFRNSFCNSRNNNIIKRNLKIQRTPFRNAALILQNTSKLCSVVLFLNIFYKLLHIGVFLYVYFFVSLIVFLIDCFSVLINLIKHEILKNKCNEIYNFLRKNKIAKYIETSYFRE